MDSLKSEKDGNVKPGIKIISIETEMKNSYLDYAMSVIVSRALPDVRDGLKPVHRRILFAMHDAGNFSDKPHRKSARVVGDVMGKYHPHGDTAIYDAMVRMTQYWNLMVPLINGQGNFGSMDGDEAAAPRYTEARLSKISTELLEEIGKETVDFQMNYDDTLHEPKVLPAKFPNLLVNGTNGIAVGMATYIPTHNLLEVINGAIALMENSELLIEDLIQYIPGPDFPTGGTLIGHGGIYKAYKTGRGSVIVRSKSHIEDAGTKEAIIITEIPYQVNKSAMVEKIASLVKEKIITEISAIRDESNRDGVRVVIELKKDAVPEVVLNQLYRFSPVQSSVSFNMRALIFGRPEQLNLKQILEHFIEFRKDVITRGARFDLQKARDRAHIVVGFAVVVANLDTVIELIKNSADKSSAKKGMLEKKWMAEEILMLLELVDDENDGTEGFYKLTEAQADAILDLRLHRITGLEREKIKNELKSLSDSIKELLSILSSKEKILEIIKNQLIEIKTKYGTERKTTIENSQSDFEDEDLIQKEDIVITTSLEGYIKRVPLSTYRTQKRGGRGRSGMTTKEEDIVDNVIILNTHDTILFFSSHGRVYSLKGFQIPIGSPQSRGRAIVNLLPLKEGEKISTILISPLVSTQKNEKNNSQFDLDSEKNGVEENFQKNNFEIDASKLPQILFKDQIKDEIIGDSVETKAANSFANESSKLNETEESEFKENLYQEEEFLQEEKFLVFATSFGNVRRNRIADFKNIQSNGKKAMVLDEKELLIDVKICTAKNDIMLSTHFGLANRFSVNEIRVFSGRESNGVKAIKRLNGDFVIGMTLLHSNEITSSEKHALHKFSSDTFEEETFEEGLEEGEMKENLPEEENLPETGEMKENLPEEGEALPEEEISLERLDFLKKNEEFILVITEKGYGKRTSSYEYRKTRRASKGVASIVTNERNGNVAAAFPVEIDDEIILITDYGRLIRCSVNGIRITRRVAKGVIIVKIDEKEKVVGVSRLKASYNKIIEKEVEKEVEKENDSDV